ncbi:hypothetical protein HJG60_007778 [Phyllostomus discolor]|uniref:Uncharacterized protein n=1 Tax=Phyllostomus discolor TaxID=89673 RepID=A0A834BH82_9CHIR|nr:hypothetical protein HJG60_007778 [Phyllostomus discolor]
MGLLCYGAQPVKCYGQGQQMQLLPFLPCHQGTASLFSEPPDWTLPSTMRRQTGRTAGEGKRGDPCDPALQGSTLWEPQRPHLSLQMKPVSWRQAQSRDCCPRWGWGGRDYIFRWQGHPAPQAPGDSWEHARAHGKRAGSRGRSGDRASGSALGLLCDVRPSPSPLWAPGPHGSEGDQ